jgi:hypothetical protein
MKMAIQSSYFAELADEFGKQDQSKEDITKLGENALVVLYKGSKDEGLDSLRYRRFCEKGC